MKTTISKFCFAALLSVGLISPAWSIAVAVCSDINKNHMTITSSWADSCLASGVGNIQGSNTDLFANGTDWKFINKTEINKDIDPVNSPLVGLYGLTYSNTSKTNSASTGTWSFSSSFWTNYSDAALGFKFGTGNQPDEWFVLDVKDGISSGIWEFINLFGKGGGLSHLNLYAKERGVTVSEPATLGLLGLGLLGLSLSRRRAAK